MHERSVNKLRANYIKEVQHSRYLTAKLRDPAGVAAFEKKAESQRKQETSR